jgi:short-subunit dehydrogenase
LTVEQWLHKQFDRQADWVLVTGASSGIGLEYLKAFAGMGCRCLATSNDPAELEEARRAVRGTVETVTADLSTPDGVAGVLAAVGGRRVGVLVNNAGFGLKGPFLDHDPRRYADLVHLNALAPTLLARGLLPGMVGAGRGLVLHVASINACTPIAYNAVYTATKAYLLYYAYAVAHELRHTPLVFQVVLPGTTNTPFHVRQGATPSAMFMTPDVVVRRSLARVNSAINISNRVDRLLFPLVSALPYWLRVRVGTFFLKKRLKLTR